MTRPTTLGELRASGWVSRPVKDEVRANAIARIAAGKPLVDGVLGYEDTVLPQLENALLAGHDLILLGERGQAKTRIIRSLTELLDEWMPIVAGSEINDDPYHPISAHARALAEELGDEMPIDWVHRSRRFGEKLATPDTSIADLIGEVDPIKVAEGRYLSDELTIHYGMVPRTNRGIFAINELPDLAERIQVGLLNVLEERDVQIRGYPVSFDLDVMLVFSANPSTYNRSGKVIPQLKDRIGSTIHTHYPRERELGMEMTAQEAGIDLELFNKYGLTVTNAKNVIDGQIMPVPVPSIGGFTSKWSNVGELTNNTFEVSLNIPVIQTRDLNYSVRLNYDRTTSVIQQLNVPEFFIDGYFKVAQGLNMGSIFGRRFVKECSELVMPAGSTLTCGGPGSDFQKNDDGFITWVGAGNSLDEGITKNLWFTRLAAANAPWAGGTGKEPLNWGTPIVLREASGAVAIRQNGNTLPRYRWSTSHQASYKKLTAYVLVDATQGKNVYNEERQWSYGDFMTRSTDQTGRNIATAKPIGYYFRATATGGIGGLYDVLGPNNNTTEDASFIRVREVSLAYRVGRLAGMGDWTVSVIGRNLRTFTDYQGKDPEVGYGGGSFGSSVLGAVDTYGFPNLRTISFMISSSF